MPLLKTYYLTQIASEWLLVKICEHMAWNPFIRNGALTIISRNYKKCIATEWNRLTRHLSLSGLAWRQGIHTNKHHLDRYNLYSNSWFCPWWEFPLLQSYQASQDAGEQWWPRKEMFRKNKRGTQINKDGQRGLIWRQKSDRNISSSLFCQKQKRKTMMQVTVDPTLAMEVEVEVSRDPSCGRIIQPCWVDKHLNYGYVRWNADTMHKPTWTQLWI